MNFFIIICGVIGGIILYSSHDRLIIGGMLGAALAMLFSQLMEQAARIGSLEKQLKEARQRAMARRSRAIKPAAPAGPAASAASQPNESLPELEVKLEPPAPPSQPRQAAAPPRATPPTAYKNASAFGRQHPQTQAFDSHSKPVAPEPPGKTEKTGEAPLELWDIAVSYFTGGNVVVRVGILILFFGVAFLMKYSIEKNLIPIELRLAGIYLGGLALLVFGWRLRTSRQVYSLILQGGGIGILYLTTFGAMKLYHLVPFGLALALMVGISVFSAFLAILQDARSLAVIGITGGFLAPVLTSTGTGSHVMLFSYYALLNGGILFTAWHKSWRELNLVGFVFTFMVATLWGNRSYQPELFASTEPFLIIFFLYYLAIGILFARNQPLSHKGYIDCTMVFGTPLVSFALQTALVRPYPYGIAWSALALGLVYTIASWAIFRRGSPAMRTLIESFLALGVIFGTIAIPLALDGRWTAAAWALEGSAIVWIAIRQHRDLARIFGLLLQLGAGLAFLSALDEPTGAYPLINGFFLGCLAVSLAGLFTGFILNRQVDKLASAVLESTVALAWGLLWWFGAGLHEIHGFVLHHFRLAASLIFFSLSGLGFYQSGRKLPWSDLCQVYKLVPPIMVTGIIYSLINFNSHLMINGGWLAWPVSLSLTYYLLYRDTQEDYAHLLPGLHLISFLLLTGLCTQEAWWWTAHVLPPHGIWPLVTAGMIPALFVFIVCRYCENLDWPVGIYIRTYLYHALGTICLLLWLGSIIVNLGTTGDPHPLPYLPLINPLDLAQVFVLGVLGYWVLTVRARLELVPFGLDLRGMAMVAGGTLFYWLNCVLIRTIHHWGRVPMRARDMINSDLCQTSLSIFWILSALVLMSFSAGRAWRKLWMTGAALVGVVVAKLFLFDLASTNTIERIVSFIGVGVICLIIGYLAPMPQEAHTEGSPE